MCKKVGKTDRIQLLYSMLTEKERVDAKLATLYELRLLFAYSDKEEYTKEEILDLLDKIAMTKET